MENGSSSVVVVGAVHVDYVVTAPRLPGPGETVVGSQLSSHGGGKGANAALAARRNGADVTLVGAVGHDEQAPIALADLAKAGVRVDYVRHVAGQRTGTALIVVDDEGQNQIAVAPGAGASVTGAAIAAALDAQLPAANCVLVSTEISHEAVAAAVEKATAAGVLCVLNCAPPYPGIVELLGAGPILSPNQRELAMLDAFLDEQAGVAVGAEVDVPRAALRLTALTAAPVVVTLGADGALLAFPDQTIERIPAPQVDVRDTTGAGDTFNGVLAAQLGAGVALAEATELAVAAASMSVRALGARAGMPTAEALSDELSLTHSHSPRSY